ncbi:MULTISPECIES: DNA-3-methyladenine glycosylase I [unclassified Dokdonia]|uniref:DNA-3-methyladenine glycosylase I n=1 Tax=unclassified Dokdonia TaxID=2615033 RepID=UPI0002F29214|nr:MULTISPECIES: DNA-3-methyladenine glycosylase I [unclassified Dokdonia]
MTKNKCSWCVGDDLYEAYHDNEWGTPLRDEDLLFEFLVLETFQAGLSWITILKKRENFRVAFDNFDYKRIAAYKEDKIQSLLQDAGIIRNKLKVRGTVTNARLYMEIQEEFGSFSKYLWAYVDNTPIQNEIQSYKEAPANTPLSDAISKDLKKRGFKFVGSTIIYAFMQAIGMVNDHEVSCFRYNKVQ